MGFETNDDPEKKTHLTFKKITKSMKKNLSSNDRSWLQEINQLDWDKDLDKIKIEK